MNNRNWEPSFMDRNRIIIKGFLVGVLILLMLIPGAFIAYFVHYFLLSGLAFSYK